VWFVVDVCGANVEAVSIGMFAADTESVNLDVGSIGADHLPVDLDL
jgi:hypothetical protein